MSLEITDHETAASTWDQYDLWIPCAEEITPDWDMLEDPRVLYLPLEDVPMTPGTILWRRTFADALHGAKAIAYVVAQGGNAIVSCHLGLNRSGLIGALAMIIGGATAAGAIQEVRNRRGEYALSNSAFVRMILEFDASYQLRGNKRSAKR